MAARCSSSPGGRPPSGGALPLVPMASIPSSWERGTPSACGADAGNEQDGGRELEPGADLGRLAVAPDARAEIAIDSVETAGAGCREGLAAGLSREQGNRRRIGRHL